MGTPRVVSRHGVALTVNSIPFWNDHIALSFDDVRERLTTVAKDLRNRGE